MMRVVTIITGIFVLGLMLNAAVGQDWVYKWVDTDGVNALRLTAAGRVQRPANRRQSPAYGPLR